MPGLEQEEKNESTFHYSCVLEKWTLHCEEFVDTKLKKLVHEKDKEISLIAIGPDDYFAIICEDGTSRYHGGRSFNSAMQETGGKRIKYISFGADDTYAITKNNGWATGWLDEDILKEVNNHNGNINFIALSPVCRQWIIGLKNGEFKFGNVVDERLRGLLKALSEANCKVIDVVIGDKNTWIIHHEKGLTVHCDPKTCDLWDWLKEKADEIDIENVNISLFDQEARKVNGSEKKCGEYRFIPIKQLGDDEKEKEIASLKKQNKKLEKENKDLKKKLNVMNKKRKLNEKQQKQSSKRRKIN